MATRRKKSEQPKASPARPSEVTRSEQEADFNRLDGVLATPKDQLDAVEAIPPVLPRDLPPEDPKIVEQELDQAGMEDELPQDQTVPVEQAAREVEKSRRDRWGTL